MKKIALLLLVFSFTRPLFADTKIVEDFKKYKVNEFPASFKTWPFQRGDAKEVYHVKEEKGAKYLAADDSKDYSKQIYREISWDPKDFPYFNWKWRARTLPKNAAEDNGATNDSACGVYILFGRSSGTALKFVWSTTLPVNKIIVKKEGKMAMKVLEMGTKNLNKWMQESIDLAQVTQELLKHGVSKKPTGFAILTDGNATHSTAACDYADFTISSEPTNKTYKKK